MTVGQLLDGVAAKHSNFTPEFRNRAQKLLPTATQIFASSAQWEFMDVRVASVETEIGSSAAGGYTRLIMPGDLFKVVTLSTANRPPMKYINRARWEERQRSTVSAGRPLEYTVIGKDYVLSRPTDGTPIRLIYTRRSGGYTLDRIPDQYHVAVQAALELELTPAMVQLNGIMVSNPALRVAEARFATRISTALSMEEMHKDRDVDLELDEMHEERLEHR
jgi:hypothetical protein